MDDNFVIKTIKDRRSTRSFRPEMPSDETINAIISAGTYAPSGMNRQSPIIIAVRDRELKRELSRLNAKILGRGAEFDPFYNAPVILVVLADRTKPTYLYDGCMVMANLMIAAESLGVGSCWIHRAKEEFETEQGRRILKSLGITGDFEGIGHLIIGYAKEKPTEIPSRKADYIYRIGW